MAAAAPKLVSIQVGLPRAHGTKGAADPLDRPWVSGIFKEPVAGPVWVRRTNIDGDGQADHVNHGAEDKAVLAYSADHYPGWRSELALPELPYGGFGENFTIEGQTEADVCLGDIWQLGAVEVEISQPRLPCWKLTRRWHVEDLALRVERNGHAGWYLRVRREGQVEAGAPLELVHRPHPAWTVARALHLKLHDKKNLPDAAELAALPALAESWREALQRRIAGK